jgi:hypothetical protein
MAFSAVDLKNPKIIWLMQAKLTSTQPSVA